MSMKKSCKTLLVIPLLFSPLSPLFADDKPDAQQLFKQKCSLCHAIDKKKLGPAVNAMSSDEASLRQAVTRGRNSMPGFANKLTRAEIDALVDYLLANQ